MHLVMPWFFPFAAFAAWQGARAAHYLRGETRRRGDLLLLLVVTASPLLFWLIAQFNNQLGSQL